MLKHGPRIIGPVLFLDELRDGAMRLSALFIAPLGAKVSPLLTDGRAHPPEALADYAGHTVSRIRFATPSDRPSHYEWSGERFEIAAGFDDDMRLAFVSCNGEERADLERDDAERNAMWMRLAEHHTRAPFSLLLHGGDQIYADEATAGHRLSEGWPRRIPKASSPDELRSLREHLRERFFERYRAAYAAPAAAWLMARVPSLMQWDDHDICDGWGSLAAEATTSEIGRTLFSVARESALLFQHAARDGDLPARFADPAGRHLGWRVDAPDLRLLAPDLRSERTRRRIMGEGGWAFMEACRDLPPVETTLLMSSVPLLGPRLSVIEALIPLAPGLRKYEDDLRDQWQSRAHREEWIRMLRLCEAIAAKGVATFMSLSGEIHLATRAELPLSDTHALHQLVASGIAHRPPPALWARALGAIAWLGEEPLQGRPISIKSLPGRATRYVAERNALLLQSCEGAWVARWDLEHSGLTQALEL